MYTGSQQATFIITIGETTKQFADVYDTHHSSKEPINGLLNHPETQSLMKKIIAENGQDCEISRWHAIEDADGEEKYAHIVTLTGSKLLEVCKNLTQK